MVAIKLIGAAALSSLVSSAIAGNAIIQNSCSYPLTLQSTATGQTSTIAAGAKHTEALKGHSSLKLGKDSAKITQFEYTVDDRLWYDISFVDCANGKDASGCPGWAGGIHLSATGGSCAVSDCGPGKYCPTQAYFATNDDKATKSCQAGQNTGDITMVLCSVKKAKKSIAGRLTYETRDAEENEEPEQADLEEVDDVENEDEDEDDNEDDE